MGLPVLSGLDVSFYKTGPFVYLEAKSLATSGLEYSFYKTGPFVGQFLGPTVSVGYKVVFPTGDVTIGTWTEVPLYDKINEISPDNSDFISSSYDPSNDTCEVYLSGIADPVVSTGHLILYNFQKEKDDFPRMDLTVGLYQGTSFIAQQIHTGVPYGWTTGSFTLSESEADSITDYSNLRLRFTANQV